MIYGVGTDIIQIQRIKNMKSHKSFAQKILSKEELHTYSQLNQEQQIMYLSKQFSGKEAFSKAIGKGITGEINFKSIKILRDSCGKPFFDFSKEIKKLLNDLGIRQSHVSLSDESEYAIAFVILEK